MPAPAKRYRDQFDHWKLDVYKVAVDFFADAYQLAKQFRREDAFLRVQFLRAALSIPLNIAEGCGEFRPPEKARFYRMARCSAEECSSVLNAIELALHIDPDQFEPYHKTLVRIMAMLLNLIRRIEGSAPPRKRSPWSKKPQTKPEETPRWKSGRSSRNPPAREDPANRPDT